MCWHWGHITQYSRSISFFSLCLTQCRVDDCGQPMRVCRQHEHTETNRVKARHSELLDLPGISRSSSILKSVWYSIKYALINTVSSISTGRSLSTVYSSNNITWTFLTVQSVVSRWKCSTTQLFYTTQLTQWVFAYLFGSNISKFCNVTEL